MKTMIELSEDLIARARQLARSERRTLPAIVEEGILLVLDAHARRRFPRIKPVVFQGEGLSDEFSQTPWHQLRKTSYSGRGG